MDSITFDKLQGESSLVCVRGTSFTSSFKLRYLVTCQKQLAKLVLRSCYYCIRVGDIRDGLLHRASPSSVPWPRPAALQWAVVAAAAASSRAAHPCNEDGLLTWCEGAIERPVPLMSY